MIRRRTKVLGLLALMPSGARAPTLVAPKDFAKPKESLVTTAIDVAGDLQLSQAPIAKFQEANPLIPKMLNPASVWPRRGA